MVFPLHASIQERCRLIGYDNLAPIIWYKIANAQYEMGSGGFFGKPYEPNGVVKNDVEYILFQRKPGGYRKPDDVPPAGSGLRWPEFVNTIADVYESRFGTSDGGSSVMSP